VPKTFFDRKAWAALNRQNITLDNSSKLRPQNTWTITNSFRAAYTTWDETSNWSSVRNRSKSERYFEYEDYPLDRFYNLNLQTTQDWQTKDFQHQTIVGVEVNKNPFTTSGEGISSQNFSSVGLEANFSLPSPFVTDDFISKKNYLGLYLEHETKITSNLSLYLEGTLDAFVPDTTDIPELPTIELQQENNFSPELSLSYQLSDATSIYTTFSYFREPVEESDESDNSLKPQTYRGIELGLETQLFNSNLFASVYLYNETQNHVTTTDPDNSDLQLQIAEQTSQSLGLELKGEITPGWNILFYYNDTDARVSEDIRFDKGDRVGDVAHHNAGFWTTYQFSTGSLQGFGFGCGLFWVGDRPGDPGNTFSLPSYLQTDLAIFYRQNKWKAAIAVQNLLNAEVNYSEGTPLTILGTAWLSF
jgi:outer membrane receptor for ferric coprogen and ferric-rhodotorulic acid